MRPTVLASAAMAPEDRGMGRVVESLRRVVAVVLLVAGGGALAQPAADAWPNFAVARNTPCSVEWDDLGTPPCNRAAFETRYVRMNTMAVIATGCGQRDEAWARDLGAATAWLLAHPRPGTNDRPPDAAAEARVARRVEVARERAREQLAREQQVVCADIWESTRLAHADQLVAAVRADRAAAEACRAGAARGAECERVRNTPR